MTSKLEDQLRHDLKMKLHDDLQNAVIHFTEMCQLADIPSEKIFSALMHVLATYTIEFATFFHIPRDKFIIALGKHWDYREKRRTARD